MIFWRLFKEMKKGNVNYAISGRVFYVNLCIDNVKNRILFFYPREFPGRPSGALQKIPRIFWQIFKEMKKDLQLCNFRGYFHGYFYESLLQSDKELLFFLFLRRSSRGALRALYKRIQGFFGRYSKKRKKEMLTMQFSGVFL